MKEHAHAVYIGRFQPFHLGHLEVVKQGLELAEKVTIVVGSANAAPNIKNPWSFEERKTMIRAALGALASDVNIVPVRDYYYNENAWIADVQAKTAALGIEDGALLLGNYKDASSYYLKYFPQWEFTSVSTSAPKLSSTDIREWLFDQDVTPDWEGKLSKRFDLTALSSFLPGEVWQFIQHWTGTSPTYCDLVAEARFIESYHASWASAPFPPFFVTTDAIVVCSGHVLVVKRKHNPGKGLYALPGGFLKPAEKIRDGMLRELKEETKIKLDKLILNSSVVDEHVFDHPQRSLRGRTITHGFYVRLKDGALPEVKAADDAAEVLWMPLMDVGRNENMFFEDHAHIINYFVGA